jgi:hypothetical protein
MRRELDTAWVVDRDVIIRVTIIHLISRTCIMRNL